MRYTYNIFPALAITAVLASACTKDIEYNGPGDKNLLVANCIVEAGTQPVIKMSRSRSFLEDYSQDVELDSGVDVRIDINGETRQAKYTDLLGGYTDNRTVHEGDVITISASHPDYGSLRATDTVPVSQNLTFTDNVIKYVHSNRANQSFFESLFTYDDRDIDSTWVVNIEIKGRRHADDYYMLLISPILIYERHTQEDPTPEYMSQSLPFRVPSTTKVLLGQSDAATAVLEETSDDEEEIQVVPAMYTFSDEFIKDGQKISFEVLMTAPDTAQTLYKSGESGSGKYIYGDWKAYRFITQLYVLSKPYYMYWKSTSDYEETILLSEPVTIIHNVKGGLGILGSYAKKYDRLELVRDF